LKGISSRWAERLQFTLLFLVLTVLMHHLFGWIHTWLSPVDPYKIPEGGAAKVFRAGGEEAGTSPADRLKLFFWLGE
jgi:hypothetical protein